MPNYTGRHYSRVAPTDGLRESFTGSDGSSYTESKWYNGWGWRTLTAIVGLFMLAVVITSTVYFVRVDNTKHDVDHLETDVYGSPGNNDTFAAMLANFEERIEELENKNMTDWVNTIPIMGGGGAKRSVEKSVQERPLYVNGEFARAVADFHSVVSNHKVFREQTIEAMAAKDHIARSTGSVDHLHHEFDRFLASLLPNYIIEDEEGTLFRVERLNPLYTELRLTATRAGSTAPPSNPSLPVCPQAVGGGQFGQLVQAGRAQAANYSSPCFVEQELCLVRSPLAPGGCAESVPVPRTFEYEIGPSQMVIDTPGSSVPIFSEFKDSETPATVIRLKTQGTYNVIAQAIYTPQTGPNASGSIRQLRPVIPFVGYTTNITLGDVGFDATNTVLVNSFTRQIESTPMNVSLEALVLTYQLETIEATVQEISGSPGTYEIVGSRPLANVAGTVGTTIGNTDYFVYKIPSGGDAEDAENEFFSIPDLEGTALPTSAPFILGIGLTGEVVESVADSVPAALTGLTPVFLPYGFFVSEPRTENSRLSVEHFYGNPDEYETDQNKYDVDYVNALSSLFNAEFNEANRMVARLPNTPISVDEEIAVYASHERGVATGIFFTDLRITETDVDVTPLSRYQTFIYNIVFGNA